MGGPLMVTPSGSTTIATDGMRAAVDRARGAADGLRRAIAAVRRAEMVPNGPPLAALEHDLRRAASVAEHLEAGLREAIARYSDAENGALGLLDLSASALGAMSGWLVPAAAFAGGVGRVVSKTGGGREFGDLGKILVAHPEWTSNPRFVGLVRGVADGMDEALTASAGVPAPLAFALGATGRTGVSTSARTLMKVGPAVGVLKESPVDVQRVDRQSIASAPIGAADRLARVPEGDQVRVERYSAPGRADRYVVYVGPTETFAPQPEGEPWDLASNVGGVGAEDVASIRATEMAMRDAGVTPDSEVQLVGFSQGGMVAARIAADGGWNAVGLQTFGAPAGNVTLPDGIQGMAVRNSEDFVPALAGPQQDHHLLQVQRTVYADPSQMPTDQAAPGHQRVAYAATAEAIDAARSSDVRTQSASLDAFTGDYARQPGSTITAYSYHADRRDGTH
jgi:hypothetical protein